MTTEDVKIPKIDEVQDTAEVTKLLKKVGDRVTKGETLATIETMKVSFDIKSEVDGFIEEISAHEGDELSVGALIYKIRTAPDESLPQALLVESQVPSEAQPKVLLVPAAERAGQEKGTGLSKVAGTAAGGLTTSDDVQDRTQKSKAVEYQTWALEPVRREISKHMTESLDVPTATLTIRVKAESILALKNELEKSYGKKISLSAVLVREISRTLLLHRKLNSTFVKGEWRVYEHVHMSVAMQSKKGLLAPVIGDADIKDYFEIDDQIKRLRAKIERDELRIDDITEGTFTFTNLGPYGVLHFDPILNTPQVCILAAGTIVDELDLAGQTVSKNKYIYLTLTFDHRLIDGYDAAMFLDDLGKKIQTVKP